MTNPKNFLSEEIMFDTETNVSSRKLAARYLKKSVMTSEIMDITIGKKHDASILKTRQQKTIIQKL